MSDDIANYRLIDVAVRWEGNQWIAYNIGRKPKEASKYWSTSLGAASAEDILEMLFCNSSVIFLPAK